MAAGAVVVGSVDEAAELHTLPDFFHYIEGVFVSIRMGNTDNLFFRIYNVVAN